MPYLGNIPATQFAELKYQDFTGGTGTSFTLNDPVGTAQELEVFVNNVRQEPGVAYTVSGTGLTMTGSIASTDDFYVVFQGKSTGTATHPATQNLTAVDGTFTGNTSVTGNATVTGDLTVDTNTLHVDATNNRVGVGLTAPEQPFHVRSSTFAYMRSESTNATYTGLDVGQHQSGYGVINMRDNQDIRFYTNDAEKVRIQAAGGISFNGDTAAANALDDYEEGFWTPVYDTTSTGFGSIGYHSQTGRYVRVGKQVHAWWLIATNSLTKSSASGSLIVTGLPYTVENVDYQSGVIGYSQTWVTNHPISNLAAYNGTHIFLYYSNGSTSHANITPSNMVDHSGSNKHYLYGAVSYRSA